MHAGHRHRLGDVDRADARVRVRAAQRVAPEHPGHDQVARVRELALHLRRRVGPRHELADRAELRACAARVWSLRRPPAARRRRSSRSRCSGRGCRRAPRGSRRRTGSVCAAADRRSRRRAPACRSRTARRPRRRTPAARGCSSSPSASPSTVVTSWPSACAASTRHAQTSVPSSSTEHEPHSPCSQAFFEPGEAELLAQREEQRLALPAVGLAAPRR